MQKFFRQTRVALIREHKNSKLIDILQKTSASPCNRSQLATFRYSGFNLQLICVDRPAFVKRAGIRRDVDNKSEKKSISS